MDIQWYHQFGDVEIILLSFWIVGYGLYLSRVWKTAQILQERSVWVWLKLPFRLLIFVLGVIALLGPSFGYGKKTVQTIGKDIFFAVDLSASMNAQDIKPSRLERAKFEISKIIQELKADRVGLIIFSGEAFLQSPLTFDKSALNLFVQTLNTRLIPDSILTTDYDAPLQLILERYDKLSENSQDKYFSKVVVLVTDGEDFSQSTLSPLQELQQRGVKVFALAIGTREGAKILEPRGVYRKDEDGNEVITRLEYATLNQITEETEAELFEITAEKNESAQLVSTVQAIKGQRLDVRSVDVSANKFEYFVWLILILISLDIVFALKILKI